MMMQKKLWASCVVGIAASGTLGQVVTLEFIGPGDNWSNSISETGSIAYTRWDGGVERLMRYTDAMGVETLDVGDRPYLHRPRINSAGQIAFMEEGSGYSGILRYTDGVGVEDLTPPDASYGVALAINDQGQVTGTVSLNGENSVFRYTDGLGMEMLDLGDGQSGTPLGFAINENGQIAGTIWQDNQLTAFRFSDDQGVEQLGDLGGDMWTSAMNNHGDVTGMGEVTGGGYHHYLYTDDSGLIDIGGDAYLSEVNDINDDRWIVGTHNYSSEALLWTPGTGWLQLASLLPQGMDAELFTAMGINNNQQIVGGGIIDGQRGIYRLTIHAIPSVPTTAVLVVAGIGSMRRRR